MTLESQARPKRPWRLLCSRIRLGDASRPIFRQRRERRGRQYWEKFRMFNHRGHRGALRTFLVTRKLLCVPQCPLWLSFVVLFCCVSCGKHPDLNTLVMIIESSPTNLDPRVGTDAYSERIDGLIFDPLVH